MLICVPTNDEKGLESQVCGHFGQAPTFTIHDTASKQTRVIPNRSEHMGGVGLPPEHLFREGIQTMLCGGLGPKAVQMFESFGIEVYVGASGTVQETLDLYYDRRLSAASMENACKDHRH